MASPGLGFSKQEGADCKDVEFLAKMDLTELRSKTLM